MPDDWCTVGDGLKALMVGRLSVDDRYKGVDVLIEAIAKARGDGAKVHLSVVGDGNDRRRLRELTSRLGLDGSVTFLGAVSDAKLHHLYQACDVFAMPSKGEGFGFVFLEAMRYGKPCIGGNFGGTPEVIDHGMDAYLVNYGDVDQLTRYMLELSRSPALRQDMGLKAFEKVQARYLFSQMRDNWFHLLDEILERSWIASGGTVAGPPCRGFQGGASSTAGSDSIWEKIDRTNEPP